MKQGYWEIKDTPDSFNDNVHSLVDSETGANVQTIEHSLARN